MKLFKKLLAVLVSVVMAFAVFAFAGCIDPDDNGNNTNNNQSGSGSGESGSGSGSGESGSGSGSQGGGESDRTPPAVDVLKVIEGTFSQELTTLTIEMKVDEDHSSILSVDLANGNVDFERVDQIYDDETDEFISYSYQYYFVRDWNLFSYCEMTEVEVESSEYPHYAGKQITDFTGKELTYEGNLLEDKLGDMYNEQTLAYIALATEFLPRTNYSILALANAADAVTVADGEVTVDFIKLAYNTLENVRTLVKGLDDKSTVGSILQYESVKAYLMSFTEIVTPEEIEQAITMLIEMFGSAGEASDGEDGGIDISELIAAILPDAEDCETTYDYIYEILSSETLCAILKSGIEMLEQEETVETIYAMLAQAEIPVPEGMLEGMITLVKGVLGENEALTDINISEALETCGMNLDTFKPMVNGILDIAEQYVSEDGLIIPNLFSAKDNNTDDEGFGWDIDVASDEEDEATAGYTEFTVLKMVYAVGEDNEIISQQLTVEACVYDTADSDGEQADNVLIITYAPEDFALLNISGNKVLKYESDMTGAYESSNIVYIDEENEEPPVEFTVTFTVEAIEELEDEYYTDFAVSLKIEIDGNEVDVLEGVEYLDGTFVYEDDGNEYTFGFMYYYYTYDGGAELIISVCALTAYVDGGQTEWYVTEWYDDVTVYPEVVEYENTVSGIIAGSGWQTVTDAE